MKFFLIVSMLVVTSTCLAEEVNVKKLNKAKWISVKTENFNIVTDANKKNGIAMAEELEHFRFFLTKILGFKLGRLPKQVPFIMAKSSGSFSALGIKDDYSGLFVRRGASVVMFANARKFSPSGKATVNPGRQTVLHELVHLITHGADMEIAVPPWYSEGIAEYFGTYAERKGQIIIGDMGLLQFRFYSMIRPTGQWDSINVESLLRAQSVGIKEENSAKNSREVDRFYARSFALVHYLNADAARRKQLYVYLRLLYRGYPVEDSFEAAFETTFEAMTDAVDNYIQGRHVYGRVFDIGKSGIVFPEVTTEISKLEPRAAMEFIIPKIVMIGSPFIRPEDIDTLMRDIRSLYPGFTVFL